MVLNLDLTLIETNLCRKSPMEIVQEAYKIFKDNLVMTSSFGKYSAVMLHIATQVIPTIPIIFVDTGYLNKDTYLFAHKLTNKLSLNLKVFSSDRTPTMQEAIEGRRWEDETSQAFKDFKREVKINPLERALQELKAVAWMSGVMKDESKERKNFEVFMKQNGRYKVHPILDWTKDKVRLYIAKHQLPINEHYFDYCKGKDQKKECGIHLFEKGEGI
jgi:phosphoadenosine phosphosulfate reductase